MAKTSKVQTRDIPNIAIAGISVAVTGFVVMAFTIIITVMKTRKHKQSNDNSHDGVSIILGRDCKQTNPTIYRMSVETEQRTT